MNTTTMHIFLVSLILEGVKTPVEPHYVAELELKCKNCKAIRTILKYGADEGVRITLRD
jgi:hypothetical protein